jgi:hypothetical protein
MMIIRSAQTPVEVPGMREVPAPLWEHADGVRPGLDLNAAVAAGGLDELSDRPAGLVLDRAADQERREDNAQSISSK